MAINGSPSIYDDIRKYLAANFEVIYGNLMLLFPEPIVNDILLAAVGYIIEDAGSDISSDKLNIIFTKAVDQFVGSAGSLLGQSNLSIAGYDSSTEMFCIILYIGYGFSKKTIRKLTGRIIRGGSIKRHYDGSIEGILENARAEVGNPGTTIEDFWKSIVENEENKLLKRKRNSKRKLKAAGYIAASVVLLFLLSSFIYSFRPLVEGDMTFGNAMLRLFSRIYIPTFHDEVGELFIDRESYTTADELMADHDECFFIEPPSYPVNFRLGGYFYYLHEDGYTTGVAYESENKYSHLGVNYIFHDEIEDHKYVLNGRLGKLVTEDGVSFYVFKNSYGYRAVFFLGEIFTDVHLTTDYISITYEDFLRFTAGIIKAYQLTVTD